MLDIDKLEGDRNYAMWKFRFSTALSAAGLLEHTKAEPPTGVTKEEKEARRLGRQIYNAIVKTIPNNILMNMMDKDTTFKLWSALEQRFNMQTTFTAAVEISHLFNQGKTRFKVCRDTRSTRADIRSAQRAGEHPK